MLLIFLALFVVLTWSNMKDVADKDKADIRADVTPEELADLFFLRGSTWLYADGGADHARALEYFDRAIEFDPNSAASVGYFLQRAYSNEMLGNTLEAVNDYGEAFRLNSDRGVSFLWRQARLYVNLGRHDDALETLNEIVRVSPDDTDAFVNRSRMLDAMGRYEEALRDAEEAVRLAPEYEDAIFRRAIALERLGRLDEALAVFREDSALQRNEAAFRDFDLIVSAYPDDALALGSRGTIRIRLNQFELAIQDLDEAILLIPTNVRWWEEALADFEEGLQITQDLSLFDANYEILLSIRLDVWIHLERYKELLAGCDRAIRRDPEDAEAFFYRGWVLSELRRYESSIRDYNEAIRLNPLHAGAVIARSYSYGRMGDSARALQDAKELARRLPHFPTGWINSCYFLIRLGRLKEALHVCEKAIEVGPDEPLAFADRCLALTELGEPERALADCERAMELDAESTYVFSHRCYARMSLRRFEEALEDCNEAIRLDYTNSYALTHRGLVWRHLGQPERAKMDFQEAIWLNPGNGEAEAALAESGESGASCSSETTCKAGESDTN